MVGKLKTANTYTGPLVVGDVYQNNYTDESIRVDSIYKDAKTGTWMSKLVYVSSATNKSPVSVVAYDFEKKIKFGSWHKL